MSATSLAVVIIQFGSNQTARWPDRAVESSKKQDPDEAASMSSSQQMKKQQSATMNSTRLRARQAAICLLLVVCWQAMAGRAAEVSAARNIDSDTVAAEAARVGGNTMMISPFSGRHNGDRGKCCWFMSKFVCVEEFCLFLWRCCCRWPLALSALMRIQFHLFRSRCCLYRCCYCCWAQMKCPAAGRLGERLGQIKFGARPKIATCDAESG